MSRRPDWSLERAFRRGEAGCLIWRGCYDSAGRPVIHRRAVDGKKRPINVRRAIMAMVLGRPLRREEWVNTTCEDLGCCAPAHLKLTTESAVQQAALAKHNWHKDHARRIKLAKATKRSYTLEQADDMRRRWAEGESWTAITALYNAKPSTLRRILDYKGYVEHLPPMLVQALRRKGSIGYTRRYFAAPQPEGVSP